MKQTDIPIWERYTLTIEEASKYFRIGENKLRRLADENKNADWLIMNGNRIQIKRKQFETNDIFVTDTLCQSRQSLLLYPVVAIDKPYVPTTSSPKPRITCTTEPSVLLSYYLYLVVFTRILFEYGRAAVGTAVVDTNDFVVTVVTLIKHRIQALRQISLDIINGNNDGNKHIKNYLFYR